MTVYTLSADTPALIDADDRVPSELKKKISQARLEKKMTQAQLAQVCS